MVLCAVGQLCSRGNVVENLIRCQSIISRSAKAGAKMIFLPEASDFIAPASQSPSLAQSLKDSQFVKAIQSSAQENNCWVSVGVHEKSAEDAKRCHNTSLIISSEGIVQQAYRKLHLFDIDLGNSTSANESKYIIPGDKIEKPLPTPIGHVGQLICYDLRFPEVALIHRRRGANILIYPSAFTMRTGGAHWETLLRARAIETQCYVIAAAQVGTHIDKPLRQSWGHAMIVDPWGTVLAQVPDVLPSSPPPSAEEDPEWSTSFALADVDLKSLELLRKSMPLLDQRRNDIYPRLD
ncbi:Carbon-nitrogen hydrolase [Puccinia graminis f. sp. tritici]|uniref:Carbon-nitrogen hydrolase n=1 Tax=Puccinia graminis f. sp. tritici TaxID=56615 RepID=A0A5B0NXZ8_PUCGR|nr:Carbon-nitrogen hydrolase [Puccinia graminis f. sp. tritici]KAA1093843.1 Carbon-nitrogen hydrolase [Puccinia graminis f. sp. tritici]